PESAPQPRRAQSVLDQHTAPLSDRGTSPARFLIVFGILALLALAGTNVLGAWSTPWQTEARKEAARKVAERHEAARKAKEQEVIAHDAARKVKEREAAAREAAQKAAERETIA